MFGQSFIRPRWARLRASWISIIQGGIAAGLAYFVAHSLLGHAQPFFAPMAAVIVLGITGDGRLRRALELNIGVAIGVGLGDLFVSHIGTGWWQMPLMVCVALSLAIFIDRSVIVYTQAALGAVLIATILPPGSGGGAERLFDAFIGGCIGMLVVAVVPISPLKGVQMEVSRVLAFMAEILRDTADALESGETETIRKALAAARGSQAAINVMLARGQEGHESMRISPLLWRQRPRVRALSRVLNPVDNAMRNTRVLARRALVLIEDGDRVSQEQIAVISDIAAVATLLAKTPLSAPVPDYIPALQAIGDRQQLSISDPRVLSAQAILAQTRSITVDLLVICGLSRAEAKACLRNNV